MNDSLWFFAKGLLWAILALNFLVALHPVLVLARDYLACQRRWLRFVPTMDPQLVPDDKPDPGDGLPVYAGFFRIILGLHDRLPRYKSSPSTRYRLRPRYLLGHPGHVLYYVLEYFDKTLGGETVTVLVSRSALEMLLLATAEVTRHGVVDHRYLVGMLTLRTGTRTGDTFRVVLEGNYIAVGCVTVLLRDVLHEIETHLGAEVRAQMRTWQVPALRTHVERPAYT